MVSPKVGALLLLLCQVCVSSMAKQCDPNTCKLPNCACANTTIPAGLLPQEVPQMVIVMFDGRLAEQAEKMIRRLFPKDLTNPNKCPISSTFYVSNENTDYCSVNRLWAEGHEIGVTGKTRHTESFWQDATLSQWNDEVTGQVENLEEKAGINRYALQGWRTPHLVAGSDTQFYTINTDPNVFDYDATLAVSPFSRPDNKTESYWPFTLDYPYSNLSDTDTYCYKCPAASHEGLWELPVLPLRDVKFPCTYLNVCPSLTKTPENTYQLLHNNFQLHYETNRSPFTINIKPRWLSENEAAAKGLENFILDMVKDDEVWIISAVQAIEWARRPRTLGQLDSFTPWGCFDRRYKIGCETKDSRNRTAELFPGLFGSKGNHNLIMYQYITLIIAFLVVYRYDKMRK